MKSWRNSLLLALSAAALMLGACAVSAPQRHAEARTGDADIHRFLDAYFAAWSAADFERYRSLFHPQARITFLQHGSVRGDWSLDAFIEVQRKVQVHPLATERSTSRTLLRDGQGATVVVGYALKRPGRPTQRGIDRFTLMRQSDGSWRILSLTFYLTG